jgi:hypothetical protein
MLLLLIVENEIVQVSSDLQWHNVHNKFREIRSTGSKVRRVETNSMMITKSTWNKSRLKVVYNNRLRKI